MEPTVYVVRSKRVWYNAEVNVALVFNLLIHNLELEVFLLAQVLGVYRKSESITKTTTTKIQYHLNEKVFSERAHTACSPPPHPHPPSCVAVNSVISSMRGSSSQWSDSMQGHLCAPLLDKAADSPPECGVNTQSPWLPGETAAWRIMKEQREQLSLIQNLRRKYHLLPLSLSRKVTGRGERFGPCIPMEKMRQWAGYWSKCWGGEVLKYLPRALRRKVPRGRSEVAWQAVGTAASRLWGTIHSCWCPPRPLPSP